MDYLEFLYADTGFVVYNAFSKQFDNQADFATSTISFSVDRNSADASSLTTGTRIKVRIDGVTLDTEFILGGNAVDYVTESGLKAVAFNGSSVHSEFEDVVVLPSAWPNPTPSGHDFQNATPGTIVKTLITRSQDLGFLPNITTASFTGTHDSNGVTWPAMMDRSYTTGDTDLSVIQGLIEQGQIDAKMVGLDLRIYVPGTIGTVLDPSDVIFRVGQNLTDGSTQTDPSDFYTDIFAIGDGDAVAMKSRPASYGVLGRRRMRFAQYGGITDSNLIGVLADLELDQYNHIKKEHSYAVSTDFYTPFIDYNISDTVPLDKGDGAIENIKIKQISVTQDDNSGNFSVGVTLGDLLEDSDEKLKRRIDAITGANAGGGAVPSDKTDDKNPPNYPASVTVSSLSYIDSTSKPKVAGLVDWPDVTTNSDGTPASDIDHYEVQSRTAPTAPSGTPQSLTPGRANTQLNSLFDRRSKTTAGWISGDGAASVRNSTTGKDYWFFGDSAIGFMDGDYKADTANGKPFSAVNNAMVVTDPSNATSFQSVYGLQNLLPKEISLSQKLAVYQSTDCTVAVSRDWTSVTGLSHKITSTSTNSPVVIFGVNFFGDRGSKTMVAGNTYTVMGLLKANAAARTVAVGIQTYNNSGTALTPVTVNVTESASVDVPFNIQVTAPVNTVSGNVYVKINGVAASETHYVAQLGLFAGDASGQTWNIGASSFDSLLKPYAVPGNTRALNSSSVTRLFNSVVNPFGGTAEKRIGWIGGSAVEGKGTTVWSDRFQTQLLTKVRAMYDKSVTTVGYLPAAWGDASISNAPVLTGAGATVVSGGFGLGGRAVTIKNNASITYPAQNCSYIDVYYVKTSSDFFPAAFNIQIDGTTVRTVDNSLNPPGTGGVPSHVRVKCPTGFGSHVVTIVADSNVTSTTTICGVEFRDNTPGKGIYFVDASHSGYKLSDFTTNDQGWQSLKDSGITHLCVYAGTDEMAALTPAQWKQSILDFVAKAQAQLTVNGWPVSITLYHAVERPDQPAAGGANPQALSLYEASAIDAISQTTNTEVVFLSDFQPSGKSPSSWSNDGYLPNVFGADRYSDTMVRRNFDTLTSDIIWLGSCWTNASKLFATGMQIGSDPVVRTNYIPNPTYGTTAGSTTGYTGTSTTIATANSSDWAANGVGNSLKVTRTTTGSTDSYVAVGGNNSQAGYIYPGLVGGKTYTFSAISNIKTAWTGANAGSAPTRKATLTVFWSTTAGVSGPYTEISAPVRSVTTPGEVLHTVTFTLPVGITQAFIRLGHGSQSTTDIIYWDNLILEERSTPHVRNDYFDGSYYSNSAGDSVSTTWAGTVDNSISKLLGTTKLNPRNTIVAQWESTTLKMDKLAYLSSPDPSITNQWTTTVWTEGGFAYLYGKNSSNQPIVMRTAVGDPFTAATNAIWTGVSWSTAAGVAQPVHTDAYTFDSIRKWGSSYSAYYMKGFDANIYRKTATSLTGPWTTDPVAVYRTPEYGGDEFTYIPRMYPQFDTANGASYGYSTNYWTSGALNRPRFAIGPKSAQAPVNITAVDYSATSTVTESKAYFTGYDSNTALQVRVRTVDTSGLVSPQWTESTPTVLTSTGGTLVSPSKPSATPFFQGVRVSWDGLDSQGNIPTGQWAGVEVHVSSVGSDFGPSGDTRKDFIDIVDGTISATTTSIPGLTPGTTYWVKLVAVGTDGSASTPSDYSSATTATLVSADLTPKLIDAAKYVQDGSVNTAQLNVAAFSEQIIPNADFEGGNANNIPNTWTQLDVYKGSGNTNPTILTGSNAISGSTSWQHTVAPGDGRTWRSSIVALVPGDVYYFAGTVRTDRTLATANSITIGLAYAVDSNPLSFSNTALGKNLQYPLVSFTGSTTGQKLEGQLKVPAGMYFGCLVIQVNADDSASTSATAIFDDLQLKRIVGTANIANLAVNNAQIADLAVDNAKIANLSVGKLTAGTLSADVTISSRIKTADTGARVELNAAGLQGYDASNNLVTQVTTAGGLVSKYFRTNTSGTRIEMGTYSTGGGSANMAFYPDSSTWQFPPAIGYGGAYTTNWIPGVAMYSGSLNSTNYAKYGLSQMGLDQVGGIVLTTGNKLDGTESTTGANITLDAGGSTSSVTIKGGGASRAKIFLGANGDSLISLPSGGITFNFGSDMSNSLYRSAITWSGFQADHMVLGAGGGLRVTTYDQTNVAFGVGRNGDISGSGAWGTAKILTRDTGFYISWDSSGSAYKNGVAAKTFVIDHPLDDDKYLIHATNEMPEARVEYTGNGKLEPAKMATGPASSNFTDQLIGANDVEITLPDYFTALVDESTAVVLVSPYYHDCDDSCEYSGTPSIAATKVKDGKFRVKAVGGRYHPCISFAWRVSAVRKDIAPLEVEPLKSSGQRRGDGPYTYFTK